MTREPDTGSRAAGQTLDAPRPNGASDRDETGPRRRLEESQGRRREEFGGVNWGSGFFGWLVAVGIATLLTALLSAAGAAVGLTKVSSQEASDGASAIGIIGGVLLLVILLVAYYAGGYVAGRMSRFAGPRQGLAVWLIGVVVTVMLAAAGALLGA